MWDKKNYLRNGRKWTLTNDQFLLLDISQVTSIGFFLILLFLIYLNSKFHKVVNMRHFATHPYSKKKNNWILKISFLESPCSIFSSYKPLVFDLIGLGLILIISVKLPQYCINLRLCWNQAQKFFVKFFLIVL